MAEEKKTFTPLRGLRDDGKEVADRRVERNTTLDWPKPELIEAVGGKVRILNHTSKPQFVHKNNHLCQIHLTTDIDRALFLNHCLTLTHLVIKTEPPVCHSDTIRLDPDNILQETDRQRFRVLHTTHDSVFNTKFGGYNGAAGKFEARINMGPVLASQRKRILSQYFKDKIQILHEKCDGLEELKVLRRPEDVNINVEYVHPSFLLKKPNVGYRLVTAFEDVGRYSKPSLH